MSKVINCGEKYLTYDEAANEIKIFYNNYIGSTIDHTFNIPFKIEQDGDNRTYDK